MRKLTLNPEDLQVESFEPRNAGFGRGTVLPNEDGTLHCGTLQVSCNHTACPLDCSNGYWTDCGCVQTDDEYTCRYTDLDSCSCDSCADTYCC